MTTPAIYPEAAEKLYKSGPVEALERDLRYICGRWTEGEMPPGDQYMQRVQEIMKAVNNFFRTINPEHHDLIFCPAFTRLAAENKAYMEQLYGLNLDVYDDLVGHERAMNSTLITQIGVFKKQLEDKDAALKQAQNIAWQLNDALDFHRKQYADLLDEHRKADEESAQRLKAIVDKYAEAELRHQELERKDERYEEAWERLKKYDIKALAAKLENIERRIDEKKKLPAAGARGPHREPKAEK